MQIVTGSTLAMCHATREAVRRVTTLALILIAAESAAPVALVSQPTTPPQPPARPTVPRTTTPRPATPRVPPAPSSSSASTITGTFDYPFSFAPEAIAGFDGARAQMEAARAQMEGQRVMMEGQRAMMEGQRVALQSNLSMVAPLAALGGLGTSGQLEELRALTFAAPGAWAASSSSYRSTAPAAWAADDPADSLYREARKALSSDAYRRAADLFRRIRDTYPKSMYTPDAPYWEAFALHRLGGDADLRRALEALEMQLEKFPKASTRGDATSLRTRVEGMLARNGDAVAIAGLASRAVNATRDGCPRAQDDERIDALNAVAQMDPEAALPILKRVIARREPCTQQLRRTAVWLVASKRQAEAASILMTVAKSDPDKDVREQAVFWMANVPTEEATSMLIELAKKGDDLELRKRAVYSLSRSKSPRAATTLREIILDTGADVELRSEALNGYMTGPGRTADDALGFLKEAYGRADDNRFRQRVLYTVAQRRNDESRAFLVDVAQNAKESLEIRRIAVSSLSSAGITAPQLAQIFDRSPEVELRKQVMGTLMNLKDNAGLDKMLDIGRNEKNVELRKQALSLLSRSKDPRVVALFAEIIEK
jgi:HEAT repeat protein